MRGAALALALAALSQAPEPREVVEIQTATLVTLGGETRMVMGGVYLPHASEMATAQELAKLRAENKTLKAAPVATPTALVLAVLIGVAGGAALAYTLKH